MSTDRSLAEIRRDEGAVGVRRTIEAGLLKHGSPGALAAAWGVNESNLRRAARRAGVSEEAWPERPAGKPPKSAPKGASRKKATPRDT